MMKSEPSGAGPNLQVAFRSATYVAQIMMSNVCVTGLASVACAKNCETACITKDGLTNNSKTTIDMTGLTRLNQMCITHIRDQREPKD